MCCLVSILLYFLSPILVIFKWMQWIFAQFRLVWVPLSIWAFQAILPEEREFDEVGGSDSIRIEKYHPLKNNSWLWTLLVLHCTGKEAARLDADAAALHGKERQAGSCHSTHASLVPLLLPKGQRTMRTEATPGPQIWAQVFRMVEPLTSGLCNTQLVP